MKHNINLKQTLLYILLALLPALGTAQTKNLLSYHRIFPKVDKVAEFEKALAAHAQKYHTGDVAWRVFAIESGPDVGGYHITEGPTTWDAMDGRGDISPEHQADWNKNVAAFLTDRQSAGYSVYIDSLSTTALGDFTDKINITHVYPKMGKGDDVVKIIGKLKKTWESVGLTVAVYAASSSGKPQYTLVTRYKQGLKERTPGFRKPFKEAYEAVYGAGAYAQYQRDLSEYVDDSWSELLFLQKNLGSK
ncbi:hypothetical protein [Flavihumibacter petaseus]|uniref:Uncharacterized protein n=1 Tax=Flavihumibacter petaseus NBRC 106054 TaxID=1220578 RepID=A0A0E9MZ84_9BACT|nr:hypothetical protein [Flavihumibacter petaseus]GAO43047.1 hypothetical protein FPE01S_02_01520 [Flavihumibacter petaseus NBRC 106054]